jgi:hypothetical protein
MKAVRRARPEQATAMGQVSTAFSGRSFRSENCVSERAPVLAYFWYFRRSIASWTAQQMWGGFNAISVILVAKMRVHQRLFL